MIRSSRLNVTNNMRLPGICTWAKEEIPWANSGDAWFYRSTYHLHDSNYTFRPIQQKWDMVCSSLGLYIKAHIAYMTRVVNEKVCMWLAWRTKAWNSCMTRVVQPNSTLKTIWYDPECTIENASIYIQVQRLAKTCFIIIIGRKGWRWEQVERYLTKHWISRDE